MYVDCASERIIYFLLLVLTIFSLYYSYNLISEVKQKRDKVDTYVLLMEHKDPDSIVQVQQLPDAKNQTISLMELLITKYVQNYESLQYDKDKMNYTDVLQDKAVVIKNLSSKNVYDDYMKNAYNAEYGDFSLALLKQQKTINIEKIEFIYENTNIVEKIYKSITSVNTPHIAKVYFSTETTSENSLKERYVATIHFNFYLDVEKKANSKIEFNVNNYYKEKIE